MYLCIPYRYSVDAKHIFANKNFNGHMFICSVNKWCFDT